MGKVQSKIERLYFIEQLLSESRAGYTRAELARRAGVHRSTIGKDLDELSRLCPLLEDENGKFRVDPAGYLKEIHFTLQEAAWVYLACRMMGDRTDRRNLRASGAIFKLSRAVRGISELFAERMLKEADRLAGDGSLPGKHQRDDRFDRSFHALVEGWARDRFVTITHFSRRRNADIAYRAGVLAIVPYPIGQSFHCICYIPEEDQLRTFRIDRIKEVVLQNELFTAPARIVIDDLLEDAWGIWYTSEALEKVVIEFSPDVAERVGETVWHRSQHVEQREDGSCLWTCNVAEPKEMLPWIRGWGKDAVVLEPAWLCEQMLSEFKECFENYLK